MNAGGDESWRQRAEREAGEVYPYPHQSPTRARPYWQVRVPYCQEECPHHDGKRCGLLGHRPGSLCEPVVAAITKRLDHRAECPHERTRQLGINIWCTECGAVYLHDDGATRWTLPG